MPTSYHVVCTGCGHSAKVDRAPRKSGLWRCGDCGDVGVEASDVLCHACGTPIPAARIAAVPQAHHCVNCAAALSAGPAFLAEPLGSREDFKRDRSSWRR